ncbi:MAG: DUF4140 domain-containing protein, partial [Nannocystaceae bacterium]|nr:DUF4140 domain-containing protein [Nannocystaceae bacterium]
MIEVECTPAGREALPPQVRSDLQYFGSSFSDHARATMLTVESSVIAVTVYRAGALVTREAKVSRGKGGYPQHVQFVGLPLALDDSSIRVEVDLDTDDATNDDAA